MAKKVVPIYGDSIGEVFVRCSILIYLARQNLTALTAQFPWLTGAFLDALEAALATAKAYPSDSGEIANIAVLTSDLLTSKVAAHAELRRLESHVEIDFMDDEIRVNSFSFDTLEAVKNNDALMEIFIRNKVELANTTGFKGPLITGGFLQADMDGLLDFADNIALKNLAQELAKINRPITTEHRIEGQNLLYKGMKKIHLAGDSLFADDWAMKNAFRLTKAGGTGPDVTTLTYHYMDSETGLPIYGVSAATTNQTPAIIVTSDASGNAIMVSNALTANVVTDHSHADYDTQTSTSAITIGDDNTVEIQMVKAVINVPFHTVITGSMANVAGASITASAYPSTSPSITNSSGLTTFPVPRSATTVQFQIISAGNFTQTIDVAVSEGMPEILVILIPV